MKLDAGGPQDILDVRGTSGSTTARGGYEKVEAKRGTHSSETITRSLPTEKEKIALQR
jgi:hypothetical protein